jgi:hypothetical protein
LQIKYCDNHVDLFTKSLPLVIFDKCVRDIGMRRLKDLQIFRGRTSMNDHVQLHHSIHFSLMSFIRISHKNIFNETMCIQEYVYLLIFIMGFLQKDMMIVFLLNCPIVL